MTEDFSYRDPKLSLWQSAAHQVNLKYGAATGVTAPASAASANKPKNPFMEPVHLVASAAKTAGKPFSWLAHAIRTGILDIEAKLHLLDDCAKSATQYLLAELEGDEETAKIYAGQLQVSECDVTGWAECLTTYVGYKAALTENPTYRPNENVVVDLGTKTKIAIIGDWGTGDEPAKAVLNQVAALKPDLLLHLGDVYYAGTQVEAKTNFVDLCRSVLGDIPLYSLCGNHDMYSGGKGYYWLLDEIGQKASYFCLQNDKWMFLAMDTGFHDNNPLTVATNMTQLVRKDGWSEAAWHLNLLENAGERRIVLLSHHQLFSPFSSVGSVGETPYAYNPNLYQVFGSILPKVEWWFWGHEHTLGIFASYMGLKRGRCVGASAVPVYQDQQSYAAAEGLQTLNDMAMPSWDRNGVLGVTDNQYNNCFAMMTLMGSEATVEYYEVSGAGGARKFNVKDQTEP